MTVIGTIDEINDVIEYFNPKYPKQNLETIKTNECFYVLNSVGVGVVLTKNNEYAQGETLLSMNNKLHDISNLIADMANNGATDEELQRAIRHSKNVIDAAKYTIDLDQSAIDNGIAGLKRKYQH